jgi:hypothetical protein
MKKSRFSEEKIIAILKELEAGVRVDYQRAPKQPPVPLDGPDETLFRRELLGCTPCNPQRQRVRREYRAFVRRPCKKTRPEIRGVMQFSRHENAIVEVDLSPAARGYRSTALSAHG